MPLSPAPTRTLTEPPFPPVAMPLSSVTLPDDPAVDDPDAMLTIPLTPDVPAFALARITLPLLDELPLPEVRLNAPPVLVAPVPPDAWNVPPLPLDPVPAVAIIFPPAASASELSPALSEMDPPVPLFPLPTFKLMLPPAPLTAFPVDNVIAPELSAVDAPLVSEIVPLAPLVPALLVVIETEPLDDPVPEPL